MRIFLVIWILSSFSLRAQSTFTVKYFGLTIHPFGDRTANLQPYRLDDRAVFVGNFGGFVGYEKFIYKDLISAKVIQGVFTDCSGGLAGITHLGLRLLMWENDKNRIYIAGGPTYIYRRSWTRFGDDYRSSGYFNEDIWFEKYKVQHKFILYGLEFEYDRILNDMHSVSLSLTPGVPLACIFSLGWKYWINTKEFDYDKVYVPRK